MKKLTLLSLHLRNFKGCQEFNLAVNGRNANVYGDNASGKTSLFDALCWLFFNKDSSFKSDFEIKTLRDDGTVEHNLSHEVKGLFRWDGRVIELKKVYTEIWTKKRGSAAKEMTGHETNHFVDSVPVQKKEYQQRISEIASEEQFKLLTSPFYFPQQMKWTERRALLMQLCGDVSDADVLDSMATLQSKDSTFKLTNIINTRSLEDHKKVVAVRRKEINQELVKLPARIDEVVRGVEDISGINHLSEIKYVESLVDELALIDQKIASLKTGGALGDLQRQLADAETELIAAKNAMQREVNAAKTQKDNAIFLLQKNRDDVERSISKAAVDIGILEEEKDALQQHMAALREEWADIKPYQASENCPTCGQHLPADQIDAARESYNEAISKRKAGINEKGKADKERVEAIDQKIVLLNGLVDGAREKTKTLDTEIAETERTEQKVDGKAVAAAQSKVTDLAARIEVEKMGAGSNQPLTDAEESRRLIAEKIAAGQSKIAKVEAHQKAVDRKLLLEKEEKKLAKEFEQLESELFLMDQFTRAKVDMLEGKINGMFSMARFRMFEENINGGLQECCKVTFNGVPFESSLNNGARVNVGLDCINTISRAQGLSLPIFIDNSESVTSLISVEAQVVRLVVSEPDKTLRVEVGQ